MNVLLVNDDGIFAEGLWALYEEFIAKNHNVYIIAPKFEQSAMSHAITTRQALRIERVRERVWSVNGTPADCVLLGFDRILKEELKDEKIDLVVSGINAGPNIGSDVIYSGTVAAAIEAMCFGYPAIAISIDSYQNLLYYDAARALLYLIENGIVEHIGQHEIININVPNVPLDEIESYVVCQNGFSRYHDFITETSDGRQQKVYWIGYSVADFEKSDFDIDGLVVKEKKVAITPMKIDYNNYKKIVSMQSWIKKLVCDTKTKDN